MKLFSEFALKLVIGILMNTLFDNVHCMQTDLMFEAYKKLKGMRQKEIAEEYFTFQSAISYLLKYFFKLFFCLKSTKTEH